MRFWSKGLGKRCLSMECGTESVQLDGPKVLLSGRVKPPLDWAYTMTIDEADWLEFFELTLHPVILGHLSRRGRRVLALRAGWNLALLLLAYVGTLCALACRKLWPGRTEAASEAHDGR
ncbi:MAG: hypothetical protein HYZ28_02815 [Myxococcales bacterium]|nr:hypothetical protein [Myxococcales bacterium]